jgi:hypothetical protein
MELYLIIGISALLQFTAAFFAFRLIRVTGFHLACVMIAAAFCIMALCRVIPLARLLAGDRRFFTIKEGENEPIKPRDL